MSNVVDFTCFRWSPALLVLAVVGCAASHPPEQTWQTHAQTVALQRLNTEPTGATPAGTIESNESRSLDLAIAEADNAADVDESTAAPARAFELSIARTVADSQETAAASAPASQPACTPAARPIERGPLPSLCDTVKRDVLEMPEQLWHDTKKVYLNPCNLLILVGAGGASLALRPAGDDVISDHYNPRRGVYHHTFSKPFRNFLDAAGNPGTAFAIAGAWYVGGQLLQDAKTYEVGKRTTSALIINDLSTLFLKLAAADSKSPNGAFYAWPSGHMSSTVCFATCMFEAYGWPVGVPLYAFSVFEGMERLDDREHQFSDVVFGAALGFVVAETVMKEHRPEIFGGEVVPYIDPNEGHAGVAWIKSLGN